MSDLPANTSTPARIAPGQRREDTLERAGDRDWFAIRVDAGDFLEITLNGLALNDPLLRVYDGAGRIVAFNDDANGLDSQLDYFFAEAGTYYIEAAAYGDRGTGSYELLVDALPYAALGDPLAALRWGGMVRDPATIGVYFAQPRESFDGYTAEGFNAYERAQIMAVLAQIETVIPVRFDIAAKAADADFRLVLDTDEMPGGVLGQFNPPGTFREGIGIFNGSAWDRFAGGDLEPGGLGYQTVVHEILHGLGLSHPHDRGGSSSVMDGVDQPFGDYGFFNFNQGVFTTMSYNRGYNTGTGNAPASREAGREAGPMAFDIAVLQDIYGTRAHATGNDVYLLPADNGDGPFWRAIWDTGGRDEIRAQSGAGDTVIDLRAATLKPETGGGGFVSAGDGVAGGFTIAAGVTIENARGGGGDDWLIGNASANRLSGNGGRDWLVGREGYDKLLGGGDADKLWGDEGRDYLRGNQGDDRLEGGAGRDRLGGGSGDDRLLGGGGGDRIDGGAGRDRLTGGNGADKFVFDKARDSQTGSDRRDMIFDFTPGEDRIDLSRIAFDGPLRFTGFARETEAGDVFLWDRGPDLRVRVNLDNDASAEMEILLRGVAALDAGDFIL